MRKFHPPIKSAIVKECIPEDLFKRGKKKEGSSFVKNRTKRRLVHFSIVSVLVSVLRIP